MRFMVIVKATAESEKEGALPDPQLMADMNKFTDELVEAGVLLGYEGLHPSSKGARVHFSGKNRTVTDGPFAETKELVAGFCSCRSSPSKRPSSGSSAAPTAAQENPRSRSARSSSQKTLHRPSPKKIFSRKKQSALNWQIRQQRNSPTCTDASKAGVIGSRVRYRSTPRHRLPHPRRRSRCVRFGGPTDATERHGRGAERGSLSLA